MITLATIVWEENFKEVLHPDSFFSKYKGKKVLVVNNVKSKLDTRDLDVIYVDEHKEEAKKFFKLNIDEKTEGYYYTIPYFVLLLKCKTPYLFNVSPDCVVDYKDDYFTDSIEKLKEDNIIVTTLPCDKKDYYDKVFSDQVFFVDVEKLKKVDYNTEFGGDFAPNYGGNCFERRMSCFMNNVGQSRWIYKKYSYKHI